MCVKMLNPKSNETMIDPASGSCGFPVHTIFYVWKQILKEKGIEFEEGSYTHAPQTFQGGSKWVMFRGPDQEHIELNEKL